MDPLKIAAITLLVVLMVHTGFQVNREHLRAVLSDYGLVGRALLANIIAVPIYGVILARAFHLSDAIAAGLLLMAMSPGGRFIVVSGGRVKGGSLSFCGRAGVSSAGRLGRHRSDNGALPAG